MSHQGEFTPCQLVFGDVRDPAIIITVQPSDLEFTLQDLWYNNQLPLSGIKYTPNRLTMVPHRELKSYLRNHFASCLPHRVYNDPLVGTLDPATYHYMLPLMRCKMLEPTLIKHHVHLLGSNQEPCKLVQQATINLNHLYKKTSDPYTWDV